VIIWQPEILDFWNDENSDLSFADRPTGFSEKYLETTDERLSSILAQYPNHMHDQQIGDALVREIQGGIVAGLKMKQCIGLVRTI
jgi:hypothetical protein